MNDQDRLKLFVQRVWAKASKERTKADRTITRISKNGPFLIHNSIFRNVSDDQELIIRQLVKTLTGKTLPQRWHPQLVAYAWRKLPLLVQYDLDDSFFNIEQFSNNPKRSPFDSRGQQADFIALWPSTPDRAIDKKYVSHALHELSESDLDWLHDNGRFDGFALTVDQIFGATDSKPTMASLEIVEPESIEFKFSSKDWFVIRDPQTQLSSRQLPICIKRFDTADEARAFASELSSRTGFRMCTARKKRYLRKISYYR